jgi:hypothetical protein
VTLMLLGRDPGRLADRVDVENAAIDELVAQPPVAELLTDLRRLGMQAQVVVAGQQ